MVRDSQSGPEKQSHDQNESTKFNKATKKKLTTEHTENTEKTEKNIDGQDEPLDGQATVSRSSHCFAGSSRFY